MDFFGGRGLIRQNGTPPPQRQIDIDRLEQPIREWPNRAGFGCSLGGPHSTNFLKYSHAKAGTVGCHRIAEVERTSSAVGLRALCAPAGNCHYASCIAKRGSNNERRPRQAAGPGSHHRWLDIRQALRDELEADTL